MSLVTQGARCRGSASRAGEYNCASFVFTIRYDLSPKLKFGPEDSEYDSRVDAEDEKVGQSSHKEARPIGR